MLKYGVLLDNSVLRLLPDMSYELLEVSTDKLTNLADYVAIAITCQLDQMWIYPMTEASNAFENYTDDFVKCPLPRKFVYPYSDLQPALQITNIYYQTLTIVFSEYIVIGEKVNKPVSPEGFLKYIAGIEILLGVPFQYDTQSIGRMILEKTIPDRLKWSPCNMRLFYENVVKDRSFYRSITEEEAIEYPYFHMIDMNAAYFAACNALPVGIGKCAHMFTPFDYHLQGLWNVKILHDPLETTGLPLGLLDSGWHPTCLVSTAYACGYKMDVLESYVFNDTSYILQEWYDKIEHCMTIDTNGMYKETLKYIRNGFLGMLKKEPSKGQKKKWYSRPDIRSALVGQSICSMYTAIVRLMMKGNIVTYMNTDSLGFLSRETFELSLPDKVCISKNVGDFKHVCTLSSLDVLNVGNTKSELKVLIGGIG